MLGAVPKICALLPQNENIFLVRRRTIGRFSNCTISPLMRFRCFCSRLTGSPAQHIRPWRYRKRGVAGRGHQLVLLALSWASGGSALTLVPLWGAAPLLELNRLGNGNETLLELLAENCHRVGVPRRSFCVEHSLWSASLHVQGDHFSKRKEV